MTSDLTKSIQIKSTTPVNKSSPWAGPAEPPEDDEFNIDDEVDIKSPILRKIIGQDSDFILTTSTVLKTTGSHQPISTNTSFEMNDEDFNKLWES